MAGCMDSSSCCCFIAEDEKIVRVLDSAVAESKVSCWPGPVVGDLIWRLLFDGRTHVERVASSCSLEFRADCRHSEGGKVESASRLFFLARAEKSILNSGIYC